MRVQTIEPQRSGGVRGHAHKERRRGPREVDEAERMAGEGTRVGITKVHNEESRDTQTVSRRGRCDQIKSREDNDDDDRRMRGSAILFRGVVIDVRRRRRRRGKRRTRRQTGDCFCSLLSR